MAHDELRRLVDAERIHDVGAMNGDGVDAQPEFSGNFLFDCPSQITGLSSRGDSPLPAAAQRPLPATFE
jgi:hypothetical protein